MKKVLAGIAAVVVAGSILAGCGGPSRIIGTVAGRQFVPAHNETVVGIIAWVPQIHEQCMMAGKVDDCYPVTIMQPIYGPTNQHVGDAWYLTITDGNKSQRVDPARGNHADEPSFECSLLCAIAEQDIEEAA